MKRKTFESSDTLDADVENVRKFSELFTLVNKEKLGSEYRESYEESVTTAKQLIEEKSKPSWDKEEFETGIVARYPTLPQIYISALTRCVEHYNPPVNLPDEPAW